MKIKRLLVLAGVMALIGLVWAAPASADSHVPSITLDPQSVPAEVGDVTITISGSNWSEPVPFFIVACPGAAGDADAPYSLDSAPAAIAMCPDLMSAAVAVEWDSGSFTAEWTASITQADIDNGGLVILAGWLSVDTLSSPDEFATTALLAIGESSEESMDDGAEEEMDDGAEESMDDGAEEEMDDGAEESMDDGAEEELPVTGSESNLLVIVGASILAAGLLVIGAGRRVRTLI